MWVRFGITSALRPFHEEWDHEEDALCGELEELATIDSALLILFASLWPPSLLRI